MTRPNAILFGAHKRPRPEDHEVDAIRERSLDMLARCLNLHTTVAVVGSGCSVPLGYPTWSQFARRLLEVTSAFLEGQGSAEQQKYIDDMLGRLQAGGPRVEPKSLMYFIGTCKRILLGGRTYMEADEAGKTTFRQFFEENFAAKKASAGPGFDPYEALRKLPIQRFVTTNYDAEIQRAFERSGREVQAFTQVDDEVQDLTRFALADLSDHDGLSVFHCHGRYDEPGSIVAGEADYQRWYLGQRASDGTAFRQSLALLFESNPLLFVGYGLSDEDLLRPLRVLGAVEPHRKPSRPVFALMPRQTEADDYRFQALYERYGIHIISYPSPPEGASDRGAKQTRAFCDALREIGAHWRECASEWQRKPPPRKVTAFRDESGGLPPCNWLLTREIQVPVGTATESAERLEEALARGEPASLIGFVGPSGCGKTRCVRRRLVALREKGERFRDGFFYWNTHYINEGVTGIDQLLDFLERGGLERGSAGDSRLERLARALAEKTCLVILDGAERLLRPTETPLVGRPINSYVRKLLSIFAGAQNQATVLWVGRLWPELCEDVVGSARREAVEGAGLRCERVDASRVRRDDLLQFLEKEHEAYPELQVEPAREYVSALCSLLSGHNYGLLLAVELVLRRSRRASAGGDLSTDLLLRSFSDVQSEVATERIGARVRKAISMTLRDLDHRKQLDGLAEPFLKRLACSLNAVSPTTLELIYGEACEHRRGDGDSPSEPPSYEDFLGRLRSHHLIVALPRIHAVRDASDASGEETETFAVHSQVREFFQRRDGQAAWALPSLSIGGMSTGAQGVDPGHDRTMVRDLVHELADRGDEALEAGDRRMACDLCRDAYSIMRGRLEANTAPRWGDYATYAETGIHLARLAKRIGGEDQWDYRDVGDRPEIERWSGALFLGELVWLYNDTALALFGEGLMADSYAVWEQAFDLSRMLEENEIQGGGYQVQVLVNLGYAFLELGRLNEARDYLVRAERMNRSLEDEGLGARIQGLRGLIYHLNGSERDAEEQYDRAISTVNGSDDLRARSFFHKLRADLRTGQGLVKDAGDDIRAARIAASEGRYPDLEIEALMSRGRLDASQGAWANARLHYEAALRAARTVRSRRLQAAVLGNLARLALDQRDAGGARYHALRSLNIANELRLGLRLCHSLVVLGLATLADGQRRLGVAYIRHARRLANRQQYWYRAREAEMKLQELGEELEPAQTRR